MTCHVPGCGRPTLCQLPDGQPVCDPHYGRWRRTGDVQAHRPIRPKAPPSPARCRGCGRDTRRRDRNWCSTDCRLDHTAPEDVTAADEPYAPVKGPAYSLSPDHEPVGSLRVACGVVFVKVAVGLWRPRAAIVWELVHGRNIPLSYVIEHVDGDRLNDDPGNLRLVRVPRVAA